jgi:peptide/nickel transport system substrate-binding protein
MKKLRWQIVVVFVTLVVVGVLLFTQQPLTNLALPEPASGGIYTEALIGSLGRLNPLLDLNNPADRDIDRLIFSSLIKFDSAGVPQPDLAESWGVSADGKIYNFTLRSNAVWHDGQPVTSDDVIFTLSLLRTEYSAYPADVRSMWDQVEITRLDDKNLKFVLPEPFVPFLDYLTFGLLPKHIFETVPADQLSASLYNLAPIGSGPYKFDHLVQENGSITGVVLVVAPNYYKQVPFIEQIVFRFYTDAASALEAYRSGEVLGISQISPDILPEALTNTNLNLYSNRLPRLSLVLLNLNDPSLPFFQEKKVRRALLMGINRQWIVDHYLNSQAIVADSPILKYTWAYYDGIEHVDYDPQGAIELLKQSGYVLPQSGVVRQKEDVKLSFTLLYPDDGLHAELADTIRQNMADIGVEVLLQAVPYDNLLNDFLANRTYQAALVDLDFTGAYDPDPYPFWHQAEATGGQNYSQWDNRAASEYLEQARVLSDPNVRLRLYRNFQVIFARELPALLLYYPVYTFGVDARVLGVQAAPMFEPADRFNTIGSWYLVTRRSLQETQQATSNP